jgi:hypothetical protein
MISPQRVKFMISLQTTLHADYIKNRCQTLMHIEYNGKYIDISEKDEI